MSLKKAIAGLAILIKQAQDLDRRTTLIGQQINGETLPNSSEEVAARAGDDLTTLMTTDIQRTARLLDRVAGTLSLIEGGLGMHDEEKDVDPRNKSFPERLESVRSRREFDERNRGQIPNRTTAAVVNEEKLLNEDDLKDIN